MKTRAWSENGLAQSGFLRLAAGNANGAQRRDALFFSPFGGAFPAQQTFGTDYISTMRAVFGFEKTFLDGLAVGGLPFSIQPYATAGFAFGQVSFSDGIFYGGPFFNYGQQSQTKTGWAAGGGIRAATNWGFSGTSSIYTSIWERFRASRPIARPDWPSSTQDVRLRTIASPSASM